MPLRKSPKKTPAFLAACRANAKKSRGPSTERAKARTRLNSLKTGRYAASFRHKVQQLGNKDALRVFDSLLAAEIKRCRVKNPSAIKEAECLAREAWCAWWRGDFPRFRSQAELSNGAWRWGFSIANPHSPLVQHNGPEFQVLRSVDGAEARVLHSLSQTSGFVQRTLANPARSGRKQR